MNLAQSLLILFGASFVSSFALAESTPRFDGRTFGIEAEGEYFTSSANLDGTSGERDSLPYDNTFESFVTKGKFDFSLKRNWVIGAGGEFVYATAQTFDITAVPGEEEQTKSGTEFNNLNVFTQFQIQTGTFRMVPQLTSTFSIEKVNRNTQDVITGEGTNQIEVGTWGMVDIALSEAYGYIGYRMQNDDRAHLLPWRLGDQFYIFRTIYTRIELGGFFPVKDDKYAQSRFYRTQVTNRVNGGSYRYYSVNPNLIEARVEGGLNATPELEVYGGITHTLSGEAVAYGLSVYGGIRYSANIRKSVSPYEKENSGYSDDVDAGNDASEAEDNAAAAREERAARRAPRERTFRQKRRQQQFAPQLEDYNPAMFEKEMNKGKRAK